MNRTKVFKANKRLATVLLVLGSFLAIVAVGIFIKSQITDGESELGLWDYLPLFLQGILLIVLASFNLRSRKYFIEWDEQYLNYYLPKNRGIEKLEISQITGIQIGLFEIQIKQGKELKTLDLENVQFEEIKSIKSQFLEISQSLKS